MDGILHSVLLGIGSLLGTALLALVASFMKKNGIEMTAAQSEFASKIVHEGIGFAEEWAAKKASPPPAAAKLEVATNYVTARTSLTNEQAVDAIHAHLPSSASQAGATFDPTKSTPA